MWEELKSIDIECGDQQSLKTKSAVAANVSLTQYFYYCCRERHYYFQIKNVASLSAVSVDLSG